MNYTYVLLSILIMALVTYLPRMLPLVLFRKTIYKIIFGICALCGTWCYDISEHSIFHIAGRRFFAGILFGRFGRYAGSNGLSLFQQRIVVGSC